MSGVDAYYVLASGCKNHQSTSVSHFCVDGMAEYLEFAFRNSPYAMTKE
ncbi:hypothetical protein F442_16714 [Phytophthora nicotianae P10297]|uniref:Uncharacterized protein n=3 Tax=Phytophthora nicotianae TaxID=4792 RepID=V9ED78_PHYNI|nr:hypothetical protein F443_16881 [Phytophthora nicotianae P1569]ETO65831.1 hypothetical protein F444_16906 [Phytophthora nicotianae P1976]ETP35040.1 hypothetical protein F442_16714 [Phytophthora nicotianae P10297]